MNTTKNYNKLLFNLKKLKRYFFYNKSYLFISISYISISFFLFIFLNFASRNFHTMWHHFYENTQMIIFIILLIFFSIRNFVKGFYMRFSKELKLYMQEGESITLLRVLNYIFFTIILSFSLIVSFYSTNILSEFIIANVNKYTENFLFPLVLKEVSETTVFLTFLIGLLSLIINSYKIASKIYNFPKI